ncbi:MAG TPA: substrate-binding domain-containing protein [Mycobacteriales bacterium]|nr:substrate-binding domain-containing protein [Mycobacteriales bacterium]
MGRHRSDQPAPHGFGLAAGAEHSRRPRRPALWVALGVLVVLALASTGVALLTRSGGDVRLSAGERACARTVRVVTSSSFAPVLAALEPALARDADCVALDTAVVDGRAAADRVAESGADVWIPDDASWAATAESGLLADEGSLGSGTVLATSPIYMVTDPGTGGKLARAGASWRGLAALLTGRSGVSLAVRDPDSSGDGMVAAGDLGEAVWLDQGMDSSAMALSTALRVTRTVTGAGPALPEKAGEVGLVPEYALLAAPGRLAAATVRTGSDHTALLRFSWLPTAAAAAAPERAAALARLLAVLKGTGSAAAIAAARLRRPDGAAPPGAPAGLPELRAEPFKVLKPHHVDHVFASWYVQDRKGSILLVLDVSGSMLDIAPGSRSRLVDLVRQGCLAVGTLLPDDSALGLWEFGSRLDPPRDYRVLLPTAPLDQAHRRALATAVNGLSARTTGTGLYDTILAAYKSAIGSYQPGMPNQVLVFTDGRNEDDPDSITAPLLAAQLKAAANPDKPVALTVVAYGSKPDAAILEKALEPVDGYVAKVSTAEEVAASFVHLAASGLHP